MDWQNAVIELHEFFQSWFAGTVPPEDIAKLEDALDESFSMVEPRGGHLDRGDVITGVRTRFGADAEVQISVDGFVLVAATERVLVGRYREHHRHGDGQSTHRHSTAVFTRATETDPWRWLHVHETWFDEPADGTEPA